ncbi:MAG TPA: hypothetical protein VJS69_09050 [Candidatus Krumholzibacteria bacterium]|nr:hypothetical protein [Candidatus Krumholzibacteria bacterium]
MDQKQWEERLDRAADRVSRAVAGGVHVLEDAYEKGKETLKDEFDGLRAHTSDAPSTTSDPAAQSAFSAEPRKAPKGSPRLGLVLVAVGIIWLLQSLGVLNQPVFPILLIVLGVYFVARSK